MRTPAANWEAANKESIANSLLAALPRATYKRLLAAGLEPVTLNFGDVLHEQGRTIPKVYFPIDCAVALLMAVTGHHPVKVGLVGYDGMVGSPVALGMHTSTRRALVQGTGTAMRMDATLFRKEILRSKSLQRILNQYKHALIGQIAQSAVCKLFHPLQARLARYLLMSGDYVRSDEIHLTHDFLSQMLGVRRVGITMAASALQKRKLIKYARGKITIIDRKRLVAMSCECYEIIKHIYDDSVTRKGNSAHIA